MGGTKGSAPVATTTCSAVWHVPSTSTRARPGEPAHAPHRRDGAPICQPFFLSRIGIAGHHVVPPVERRLHVHLSAGADVAGALDRLPRTQEGLGRDARPVGALAADQLPLDDGDPEPSGRNGSGACSPGAPPPSTITSKSLIRKVLARSVRHMYWAYQSGQSGWPGRRASRAQRERLDGRRTARQIAAELNGSSVGSTGPGGGSVTSWSSQPLPSGSSNTTKEL